MSKPALPRNLTLLYRGARLRAEWLALLGEDRLVNVINSGAELDEGGPPADVIVMDVPAQERRAAYEQVRRYYRGPLVILLGRGDNGNDLPPDPSRTLLTPPVFTPMSWTSLWPCTRQPGQPRTGRAADCSRFMRSKVAR